MIRLRLLGSIDLQTADGRDLRTVVAQPKRLALLAFLALRPGVFHRRDTLLALLWPEFDDIHARWALGQALRFLRTELGAASREVLISRGGHDVAVNAAELWCDAAAFQEHINAGRFGEALDLYRDDLLAGFYVQAGAAFDEWLARERQQLRAKAANAARAMAELREQQRNLTTAVAAARRAVDLSDIDERPVRELLELLDRLGDRAGALQAYHAFAGRLAAEFGVEPAPETRVVVDRIRARVVPHAQAAPGGPLAPGEARAAAPSPGSLSAASAVLQQIDAWRVERELGRGGMATVYLARDVKHDRLVALKILRPEVAFAVGAEHFLHEIQITARLAHPHILPLIDSGTVSGTLYLVTPYISGESLRERLVREPQLPVDDALRITREVAGALDYAHRLGVVHRDVKPENILLQDGHALLADFGIALILSAAEGDAARATGLSPGTPSYMSPEQVAGDRHLDLRTDVYSLGAVLYEMLVGLPPHIGRDQQELTKKVLTEPVRPVHALRDGAPPHVDAALEKALAKLPADRFASTAEFARALEDPRNASVIPAPAERSGSRRHRAGRWLAVGVVAIALLAVAAVFGRPRLRAPAGSRGIAPQRVVVATFQNKTGDATLDPLSAMASDWIARGLAGTGLVDVAGTAAELASRGGVRIPRGPSAVMQLGLEARAGLVISGAFFRDGNSLRFQAEITDVVHGRLLQTVGPVSAPAEKPLEAIEQLRRRVTGALAPFLDRSLAELAQVTAEPPSYDAYREFLRGETLFYQDEALALGPFLLASADDSVYQLPLLRAIALLANQARGHEADSLIRVVRRRGALLTEYERGYLNFLEGQAHGDFALEEDGVQRMRLAAPRSEFVRYLQAHVLENTGDPKGAVELLQQLDPRSGTLRGRIYYYRYYVDALHALGQYRRALDVARLARRQYPDHLYMISLEAPALAVLGRDDELIALLDSISVRPPVQHCSALGIAAAALWEAEAHGQIRSAARLRPWLRAHLATDDVDGVTLGGRANALAALHDWTGLQRVADALTADEPHRVPALGLLGLASAQLGDSARALASDSVLASAPPEAYGADNIKAARGLIAAALGHKARAVALLRAMSARGWSGSLWHKGYLDIYSQEGSLFELLRGYPPFEELLVPRR